MPAPKKTTGEAPAKETKPTQYVVYRVLEEENGIPTKLEAFVSQTVSVSEDGENSVTETGSVEVIEAAGGDIAAIKSKLGSTAQDGQYAAIPKRSLRIRTVGRVTEPKLRIS